MKKGRFLIPLLAASMVLAPLFFTNSCANTTQAPTGGAKDTIPPLITDIHPLPGTVGFPLSGGKIVFYFNEYVTIKKAQSIYLSPPQRKRPLCKVKGKSLVVTFPEDLEPNTTYVLNLNDALADNNEGNVFLGFTYAFSTGETMETMFLTGMVQDCNTLDPVKGATVMLYKDHGDSAVFLKRPSAAAITDSWGYFVIPYIQDTLYRIYALKDTEGNNVYDPDQDLIAFLDSTVRPRYEVMDTIPELLKYDMTDTLGCQARRVEHVLTLFREKPSRQFLKDSKRTGLRSGYLSFQAPDAWIDSVWAGGYRSDQIISQFNLRQDSLEFWVNDRRPAPDTLHLFVNYRKTDSTGRLKAEAEHLRLPIDPELKKKYSRSNRRNLKHDDTTCLFKLNADPKTVEQNGLELIFEQPLIYENFDSLRFYYRNPRQREFDGSFSIERDSLNLRRYILRPELRYQRGFEYFMKVPHRAFRDLNGYYSDSLEVKFSLPSDDKLSTLNAIMTGVHHKYIVDLQDEKRRSVLRSYIIERDGSLAFPYLSAGKYCLRVTEDANLNSIVDAGSLLEHRQPEKVRFVTFRGDKFLSIPEGSVLDQTINLEEIFKD